ncbi:MAG: hemerythrin domain-containing protein [Anaerolineaceae bacterium]
MTAITQPLRDEHKEIYPHIESLKQAGMVVHGVLTQTSLEKIDEAYSFLATHLLPHAHAEEAALYPVVQKVMGSPHATATMSRDHLEVERLTRELAELRGTLHEGEIGALKANELKRLLYGLYTLVKVHFAKEEEVYLPLLDANLTTQEAQEMFSAMDSEANKAKGNAHA